MSTRWRRRGPTTTRPSAGSPPKLEELRRQVEKQRDVELFDALKKGFPRENAWRLVRGRQRFNHPSRSSGSD